MPTWYLILSAVVAIGVLLGVAYAEYAGRDTHEPAFAGDGEFDTAAADAATHRETETAFEWDERRDRTHTTTR